MNTKQIYKKIAKANNFWIRPWLVITDNPKMNAICHLFWINLYQGCVDNYTEDEMAFVLAHELAHLRFSHFLNLQSPYVQEYEADQLGAQYMAKAGYDLKKGVQVFKKWKNIATDTHPSSKARLRKFHYILGEK